MLLADLGAKTIKIEPPVHGEGTRRLLATDPENSVEGMGAYFLTLNRNKQSIALDLKSEEGREIFYGLVRQADVVVDNFSRGVTARLGIDHERLAGINPRIITCSITGFGETGPDPDRPAFDLVAQGIGGGMSLTGFADGPPLRAGIPIGDLAGGMFGAIGILAALNQRQVTGQGQHIDVSMLDCQISMLNYIATMQFLSGRSPGRAGNGHFVHVPYDAFRTSTRYLIIAVITDQFWQRLVELLDVPEFRQEAYATQPGRYADRAFINRRLQEILATETCEHWLSLFGNSIPCAPVNDLEHALNDPQVRGRDMVVEVTHPSGRKIEMPGNPIKMSAAGGDTYTSPPLLGAQTDGLLRSMLGYAEEDLARLRQRNIIG